MNFSLWKWLTLASLMLLAQGSAAQPRYQKVTYRYFDSLHSEYLRNFFSHRQQFEADTMGFREAYRSSIPTLIFAARDWDSGMADTVHYDQTGRVKAFRLMPSTGWWSSNDTSICFLSAELPKDLAYSSRNTKQFRFKNKSTGITTVFISFFTYIYYTELNYELDISYYYILTYKENPEIPIGPPVLPFNKRKF